MLLHSVLSDINTVQGLQNNMYLNSSRPRPLFYTRVHFINLYRKHKQSIITLNAICNKYDMVNPTVVFLINIEMVGVTGQWMIAWLLDWLLLANEWLQKYSQ